MDDERNFSVLVTRTEQVQVQVQAANEEQARERALRAASQGAFGVATMTGLIQAQWPAGEDENGRVVEDEPGFRWRRGWFVTASLDDRSVSLTTAELGLETPDASFAAGRSLSKAFAPYLRSNELVFNVTRRYGFAYRLEGADLWSAPQADEREMRRQARREKSALEKARKLQAFEAVLRETEQQMQAPGNAYSLFKTQGGRWSTKSVIGEVKNKATVCLPRAAWSVDIKVVNALIERGRARVVLSYARSGAPLAITLTDAVLRPF